jgi:hypothetical protein
MKKTEQHKPTRGKFSVFRQLCNLIPTHLVSELARETKVQARSFKPWSHVVAMMYAQFIHAVGLNDVCDSLRLLLPKGGCQMSCAAELPGFPSQFYMHRLDL